MFAVRILKIPKYTVCKKIRNVVFLLLLYSVQWLILSVKQNNFVSKIFVYFGKSKIRHMEKAEGITYPVWSTGVYVTFTHFFEKRATVGGWILSSKLFKGRGLRLRERVQLERRVAHTEVYCVRPWGFQQSKVKQRL